AARVQFRRVLLTIIASLFYGLGWLAAKFFVVIWRALVWSFVAVKLGGPDGLKAEGRGGPAWGDPPSAACRRQPLTRDPQAVGHLGPRVVQLHGHRLRHRRHHRGPGPAGRLHAGADG